MAHDNRILKWFESGHLPAHLREVSIRFESLAHEIDDSIAPGPERSTALRKLLEAKDAAVRAAIQPGG